MFEQFIEPSVDDQTLINSFDRRVYLLIEAGFQPSDLIGRMEHSRTPDGFDRDARVEHIVLSYRKARGL